MRIKTTKHVLTNLNVITEDGDVHFFEDFRMGEADSLEYGVYLSSDEGITHIGDFNRKQDAIEYHELIEANMNKLDDDNTQSAVKELLADIGPFIGKRVG